MFFNSLNNSDLELLSKYLILFADDTVLFTTSLESLQSQVDSLYQYSCKWGLEINIEKTKVCVFEKRKSFKQQNIFINGKAVDFVDNFTYLGLVFNYICSFNLAVKTLNDLALRAYNNLSRIFDKNPLDIKTKISLFDWMVKPIVLYGAEVWGVYHFKSIDNLHLRFLRNLLGVKKQTPICAAFGGFGRLPFSVICKQRELKFWCKVMSENHSNLYDAYIDQCNYVPSACWAKRVNSMIDHLGLTKIRLNFNINVNSAVILKTRLYDQYVQSWNTSINKCSKLTYYCRFKKEFIYWSKKSFASLIFYQVILS